MRCYIWSERKPRFGESCLARPNGQVVWVPKNARSWSDESGLTALAKALGAVSRANCAGERIVESVWRRREGGGPKSPYRPWDGAFRLLCMDRQPLGTSLNLADPKQQEAINSHLDGVEFLVLDNLSTLVNGGAENDAESWISMQAWLLQLRRRGVTVLVVHHAGRGGNARGTSKREDVLDTVIQLKHPEDYDPGEGAHFEVHLTKAREVFGEDALAFEAKLELDEDGAARWVCTDLKSEDSEDVQKVLELSQAGKSTREIGKELSMSKSRVDRLLKKAKRAKKARPTEPKD